MHLLTSPQVSSFVLSFRKGLRPLWTFAFAALLFAAPLHAEESAGAASGSDGGDASSASSAEGGASASGGELPSTAPGSGGVAESLATGAESGESAPEEGSETGESGEDAKAAEEESQEAAAAAATSEEFDPEANEVVETALPNTAGAEAEASGDLSYRVDLAIPGFRGNFHAPIAVNGQSFTYDANGNMTVGLEGRTIAYDASNRPASVGYRGASSSYLYGPTGSRVKKVTPQGTTLYLGGTEVTPSGETIVHPHPDVRLVDGQPSYLHRDHLASVSVVTNNLGVPISTKDYRPYGDSEGLEWTAAGATGESKGYPRAPRGANASTPRPASTTSTPATTTRSSGSAGQGSPGARADPPHSPSRIGSTRRCRASAPTGTSTAWAIR